MRKKLSALVSIAIFFFLSKGCISDYVKGGDKDAIARYEKMISDSSRTMAVLDETYKEVTIKIARVPVKHYEFKYEFSVEGRKYRGEYTTYEIPKIPLVQVYYLKSDPSFNTPHAVAKLKTEKEKNSSQSDLYWGIGWGVLCLFGILGFVSELRKKPEAPAMAA